MLRTSVQMDDLTRRGLLGRAAAASGALLGASLLGPRLAFADAAEALRVIEGRGALGKVVLER